MRVDHLSFAAGPEGLQETSDRLSEQLGVPSVDGGVHARFGTRNRILALADRRYLEVVEVLDHPAADKAPFGQVVRTRSEQGGGWLGWVIAPVSEEMSAYEERLGRVAVAGTRRLPDGTELEWRQLGVRGLQTDPQLPYFVQWLSDPALHPSADGSPAALVRLEIAGSRERLDEWLGGPATERLDDDVPVVFVAPSGQPGLASATFRTPRGEVTI